MSLEDVIARAKARSGDAATAELAVAPQPTARPEPELNRWVDQTLLSNREKNFVQRIVAPERWPSILNDDGSESSHRMMWGEDDLGPYVFPKIVYDGESGELRDLDPREAARHAVKTGELIRFEHKEEAEAFSREYKRAWRKPARPTDAMMTDAAIGQASFQDAQKRTRALGVSERLGVPPEVIEGDFEYWERLDLEQRARRASKGSPAIEKLLRDSTVSPVALRDLVQLQEVGLAVTEQPDVDVALMDLPAEQGKRGMYDLRLANAAWDVGNGTATQERITEFAQLRANRPAEIRNLPGPLDEIIGYSSRTAPIMGSVAVGAAEGAVVVGTAGAALGPGFAPAAAAGGRAGAFLTMMKIEGGLIYAEALDAAERVRRETGAEIPNEALTGLMYVGGILNASLEGIGLRKITHLLPGGARVLRALEGGALESVLSNPTAVRALARFAGKWSQAVATEGTTEFLQQIVPALSDGMVRDMMLPGDQNWVPANFFEQLADAGIAGGAAAIGLGAAGGVASGAVRQGQRVLATQAANARLDAQVLAVQGSELLTAAPTVFRTYLQDLLDTHGGDVPVLIPPDVLEQLVPSTILTQQMPDVAAQIPEARATRGDVVVPRADYLTYLQGFHEQLQGSARVGVGTLTAAEAQQAEADFSARVQAEIERHLEGREGEGRTAGEVSSDRIFDDVFEGMVNAGRSPEEARQGATLMREGIANLATRLGRDPFEYYQSFGLRVEGPARAAPAMKPALSELLNRERLAATLEAVKSGQKGFKFPAHPVLDILKRNGGVDPASTLAGELRNMGVTAQSMPGLYRVGGLESLDDLDVANEPVLIGHVRPASEGDYRVDPNDLLAAIDRELRGQPLRSEDQIHIAEDFERPVRELEAFLNQLGIDPQAATVEQVLTLFEQMGVGRDEGLDVEAEAPTGDAATSGGSVSFDQQSRGSLSFDPEMTDTLLRLTKAADGSTFLHESGHLFLELMLRASETPGVSEGIARDAKTVLDWFGVASRAEVTVEHHERWARGFEAYLRDGKAPSLALRDAFARFFTWLTRIYPSLKRLNVELPEPVRDVMDRLLASDTAIEEARRVQAFLPAFNDSASFGMTEAAFAEYQHAAQRAFDEARRRLAGELLDELDREKREEFAKATEEITAQVTADVNARPIFRVKQWLTTGKLPDGTTPEGLDHARLSRDELVALKGKEILKILRSGKFGVWQAKGGLHPEVVAAFFGFSSADHLIQMLAETGSRQEAIAIEVRERLQARFGDILRDGRLPERAIEASMTNAQGDFLLAELRALARRVGKNTLPANIARRAAESIIGGKKYRDLREDVYRSQEQRSAIRAAEAIAKRDWQTAHDEKLAEILNHFLAIEVRKRKERAEKTRKYLTRMGEPPAQARLGKAGQLMGHDYQGQVNALLFRFSFRTISNKASRARETLSNWIIAREKEGAVLQIDKKLRDETFTEDWKSLTADELEALEDAVRSIDHNARIAGRMLADKREREFAEVRDELVTSMRANVPRKVRQLDPDDSGLDAMLEFGRKTNGFHLKLEALFIRLDGGERGAMWEAAFKPLAEAEAAEQTMLARAAKEMRAIFNDLHSRGGAGFRRHYFRGIGKSLSFERVLSVALNQGNEYNKTALLEGEKWTQQQVDDILDILTEADWRAVQRIAALVGSFKDPAFDLHEELTGIRPEAVEPSEVVTKFGVLPGWYYPLKADPRRSRRAEQLEEAQATDGLFQGNAFSPMTRKGHLVARTDFNQMPVWLSLNVLTEHVYNAIHDISHRKALIQVDRLTQNGAVADAISDAVGRELHAQIRPWLKGIAGERLVSNEGTLGILAGHARRSAAVGFMALKATVHLTQFLGAANAMGPEGVGPVRFLRELGTFFSRGPVGMARRVQWAMALSPELRRRTTNYDREARDMVKRGVFAVSGAGKARADVTQALMATIGYFDLAMTIPTWTAAYARAIENGQESADAVLEADSVVRIAMGAGGPKDLAAAQRGGEIMRSFTMFYTAFSAIYAQGALTIAAIRDGRMSLPQMASAAFFLWFAPAVLDELIVGRGPDDDEAWWKWAMTEIAEYPFATIVGIRDFAGFAKSRLGGRYSDMSSPAYAVAETLAKGLVIAPVEAVSEGEVDRGMVKDFSQGVGFLFKVPGTRQIGITADALYDLFTGEADVEHQDFLFTRPPERRAR